MPGGPLKDLEDEIKAGHEKHRQETTARFEKLEARVSTLERWQSWVYGVAAGIAVVIGAFAKGILKKLGFDG